MVVTRVKAKATARTSRAVTLRANQSSTKTAPVRKAVVKKASGKKRNVRRSKSKSKSKDKVYEESVEDSGDDFGGDEDEGEVIEVEKPPIFIVFEANENLGEGLCVVRHLGDGRYELVNLNHAPRFDIATEEMGEVIKADPGRRDMLAISVEQWEDAKLKAELAVKGADGQLFRFLKLPIELRYKIYEEVLISVKRLRKARYPHYNGLGLLLSCRPIYEECLPFLYRNTFRLTGNEIASLSKSHPVFQTRLRDLSFEWSGYLKDGATFRWIAKFPQLRFLALSIWYRAATTPAPLNRNKLYQDEPTIHTLKKGHGFDSLVQIRGLERVSVDNIWHYISEEENKAFETFLMRILTLPKEKPTPKATRSQRTL